MLVTESNTLVEQGIQAALAGNRPLARCHLEAAVQADPQNPTIWLWLAWIADSPAQAESCLNWVLELQPDHPLAHSGLDWARAMQTAGVQHGTSNCELQTAVAIVCESFEQSTSTEFDIDERLLEVERLTAAESCCFEVDLDASHTATDSRDEAAFDFSQIDLFDDDDLAEDINHELACLASELEFFIDSDDGEATLVCLDDVTEPIALTSEAVNECNDLPGDFEFAEGLEVTQLVFLFDDQETLAASHPYDCEFDTRTLPTIEVPGDEFETPVVDAFETHLAEVVGELTEVVESAAAAIQADIDGRGVRPTDCSLPDSLFESLLPAVVEEVAEEVAAIEPVTEAALELLAEPIADDSDTSQSSVWSTSSTCLLSGEASTLETCSTTSVDSDFVAELFETPLIEPSEALAATSQTEACPVEVPVGEMAAVSNEPLTAVSGSDNDVIEIPVVGETPEPLRLGPTVLIADDSPTVRKLMSLTLQKRGFRVVEAIDGTAAVRAIALSKPDLILLDINMPKLDGYQLCRLIKKHEATRHIPVLMLSGKQDQADRLKGQLVGCSAYFTKPFEPDQIVDAVEQQLALTVVA